MIVCHFFELNKMEKKKERTVQCPSEEMIADYISKMNQDIIFICQRKMMQGTKREDVPKHKDWHKKALMKYYLWDESEFNLDAI